jgi:hypothetical protein
MKVHINLNSLTLSPETNEEFATMRTWAEGKEPVTMTALENGTTTKVFSPSKPMTFADFLEMKTESLPKNEDDATKD